MPVGRSGCSARRGTFSTGGSSSENARRCCRLVEDRALPVARNLRDLQLALRDLQLDVVDGALNGWTPLVQGSCDALQLLQAGRLRRLQIPDLARQTGLLIREPRIPLRIVFVEALGEFIQDEASLRIHHAQSMLTTGKVVVCEGGGRIQIEAPTNRFKAWIGITAFQSLSAAHC